MGAGIYSVFRHCARSKKVVQNLPNHRGIAEASKARSKAQHLSQENICLLGFSFFYYFYFIFNTAVCETAIAFNLLIRVFFQSFFYC